MLRASLAALLGSALIAAACSQPGRDDADAPAPADSATTDSTAAASGGPDYGNDTGLLSRVSSNPFDVTVRKAREAIEEQGFAIITTIDHADVATRAGVDLFPSTLILFGQPATGSTLIEAAPTVALDLPHKVLIWEMSNEFGETIVRVAINEAEYIAWRHDLATDGETLEAMRVALGTIVSRATSPR